MPEISIKAETVFRVLGFRLTNTLLLSVVVLVFFLIIANMYNRAANAPKKGLFFYFINFLLKSIYQLFESVLKEKTDYFFPIMASFFLFIILQNWFELIPGVGSVLYHGVPLLRGNEADLNSTLSLALISVILIQVFGVKFLGFRGYMSKFINFRDPISFFTGLLEIISEFSKIISFAFRLFGNIFAGEVLLTIMAFLVPILASFPFLLLELFVGFIQALVFAMLTAVFVNMAITKHH